MIDVTAADFSIHSEAPRTMQERRATENSGLELLAAALTPEGAAVRNVAPGTTSTSAQTLAEPALSRAASRALALGVLSPQSEALHAEHAALVDKKFAGGLTNAEQRRLELVRWHLGRLEDAESGEALDALEARAQQFGELRALVANVTAQLHALPPAHGRRARR